MAVGIEPFDGDHRAAGGPAGQPDDALVDAPEAALADLEQPAKVAGRGTELTEPELSQTIGAPLLVQLRDAPRRRDRARRLARRGPHGRARVLGLARADGRRHRGKGQVGARGRGDGGGERGGRRRRRRWTLVPPLTFVLLDLKTEAAEATHCLEQESGGAQLVVVSCLVFSIASTSTAQITIRTTQIVVIETEVLVSSPF